MTYLESSSSISRTIISDFISNGLACSVIICFVVHDKITVTKKTIVSSIFILEVSMSLFLEVSMLAYWHVGMLARLHIGLLACLVLIVYQFNCLSNYFNIRPLYGFRVYLASWSFPDSDRDWGFSDSDRVWSLGCSCFIQINLDGHYACNTRMFLCNQHIFLSFRSEDRWIDSLKIREDFDHRETLFFHKGSVNININSSFWLKLYLKIISL